MLCLRALRQGTHTMAASVVTVHYCSSSVRRIAAAAPSSAGGASNRKRMSEGVITASGWRTALACAGGTT
jgi:hypothetical protein